MLRLEKTVYEVPGGRGPGGKEKSQRGHAAAYGAWRRGDGRNSYRRKNYKTEGGESLLPIKANAPRRRKYIYLAHIKRTLLSYEGRAAIILYAGNGPRGSPLGRGISTRFEYL